MHLRYKRKCISSKLNDLVISPIKRNIGFYLYDVLFYHIKTKPNIKRRKEITIGNQVLESEANYRRLIVRPPKFSHVILKGSNLRRSIFEKWPVSERIAQKRTDSIPGGGNRIPYPEIRCDSLNLVPQDTCLQAIKIQSAYYEICVPRYPNASTSCMPVASVLIPVRFRCVN